LIGCGEHELTMAEKCVNRGIDRLLSNYPSHLGLKLNSYLMTKKLSQAILIIHLRLLLISQLILISVAIILVQNLHITAV